MAWSCCSGRYRINSVPRPRSSSPPMVSCAASQFSQRASMSNDPAVGLIAGKHILVVEDDYFVAADIACELAALGAVIIGPVGSLGAALALLAERAAQVDAASLDVNLHGELVY